MSTFSTSSISNPRVVECVAGGARIAEAAIGAHAWPRQSPWRFAARPLPWHLRLVRMDDRLVMLVGGGLVGWLVLSSVIRGVIDGFG